MGPAATRNNVIVTGAPNGRPIVFAHGFGCDQSMWRHMVPAFETDYQIVLMDHTGFGSSARDQWSPDRYRELSGYAADVVEVMLELELEDAVFVGHSVAAMIGLLASIVEPRCFGDLIMIGPSPRYLDDTAHDYVGGFSDLDIDELLETLDSNYFAWSRAMAPVIMGNADQPALGEELTASFCRTDPEVAKSFARATFLADNRADLGRSVTSTLILQCSEDPIAPREVGEYVHTHIPGSTLVYLQATGHCPNLSAPEETTGAIQRYLAGRAH